MHRKQVSLSCHKGNHGGCKTFPCNCRCHVFGVPKQTKASS